MDLIQELENQFKTGTIQEKEKVAVDFLCGVDFKDAGIREQAIECCKQLISNIEKNTEISTLQAKILSALITKIHMHDIGLDIPFKYISQDEAVNKYNSSNDTRAFYYLDSIYFIEEIVYKGLTSRVLDERFVDTNNFNKPQTEGIKLTKFDSLSMQIVTICHESQHAIQKRTFEGKNVDDLMPEGYIIDKQNAARICCLSVNSKYGNKEIYRDNHDDFYIELDADEKGYEHGLKLLQELSPAIYQVAVDKFKFKQKLQECKDKKMQYDNVTWNHKTNPNNAPVSASHKASIILDTLLPQLNFSKRKELFQNIPSLNLTYNSNGSLKTLEQVEREKQAKINDLLINGTDKEIQEKAANISKVYDTAIESHPVLCFEKCLQHMARLSWNSDRYFTDSGIEVKYNPSEVRKELQMAQAKAKAIASYMEDTDAKKLKAIFERYKRELMASSKLDQTSARFFEDKKLAIYGIESQIYRNKEVKSVIEKDTKESLQKRKQKQMQRSQAEEVIKKVFPDFKPYPQMGTLKDGSVEFSNNINEKLMLMEAYRQYVKTVTDTDSPAKQDKDFVASIKLLSAINTLYAFNATAEEETAFEELLESGKVKIIQNKYEPQKSATGTYSQEEIKSVEERSFNWSSKHSDLSNEEQLTHPTDTESDAEKARFQSQRQVAAQSQQEIMK